MLRTIVFRLLRHRHFWRDVSFNELSELYISMMFRNLALSLVGIFVPIYLYHLGFSLAAIMAYFGYFFLARVFSDLAAGYMVARIGPKHTMALSYITQIMALAMITTLPYIAWPLWLMGGMWGMSNSLFFIAYHIDFSKVKHREHGGKELGFMTIMERGGATIGPVIGGVIASFAGPQYTFLAATVFFAIGAIPLFMTGEPIRTKQHLDFKGLPFKAMRRDIASYAAIGLENPISVGMWPLFVALFVVSGAVYAKVGLLASLSVITAILAAKAIGRLIDDKKGRLLLRYSTIGNAVLHLIRPWIGTFGGALALNLANEVATAGYRMPYYKALYDAADDMPGHRIVYLVIIEMSGSLAKAVFFWLMALTALYVSGYMLFSFMFILAAVFSCLILTERFDALNP